MTGSDKVLKCCLESNIFYITFDQIKKPYSSVVHVHQNICLTSAGPVVNLPVWNGLFSWPVVMLVAAVTDWVVEFHLQASKL